jgi:hypothetical protein
VTDAVWHFFLAPSDPRWLGLFRAGVSAVGLVQVWTLWPYLPQLYGNFGFIQWAVVETAGDPWTPSIGKLCLAIEPLGASSTTCVHGVFAVYALSLAGLGVGFLTRLSAVSAWLAHALTVNSGYLSLYGVDTMLHVCLFYGVWMPIGSVFSVDAWRRRWPPEASAGATLALRVLQLHLCLIYLNTGLAKARGVQWWRGEALWRALMQPQFAVLDVSWMAEVPWVPLVAGWIVIVIELGYPFLVWPRRTRALWVGATLALHLGIGVAMGLWLFSAIMMVMTASAFGLPWAIAPRPRGLPATAGRRGAFPRPPSGR